MRHAGGEVVRFDPAPRELPVFVRAGAIVPMQPVVQYTGQKPAGPLEVHAWWPDADGRCDGSLYDDDGHSLAYRDGAFLRIAFGCGRRGDDLVVTATPAHAGFAPWWNAVTVFVHRPDGTMQVEHLRGALTRWTVRATATGSATLPRR